MPPVLPPQLGRSSEEGLPETEGERPDHPRPDLMSGPHTQSGNVFLDERGEAWVDVPSWFAEAKQEFRYQLTCIGGFAPVYVAEKIANSRFRIAGGDPGMEVSWQVVGVR